MKKIVSLLLSVVMVITICSIGISAFAQNQDFTQYPVIVVPGYSSSSMYRIDENGEQVHVWGVDSDELLGSVVEHIFDLAQGVTELTKGNAKKIADVVGEEFVNLYGDLACNPDGSSVYDLKRYCVTAEESCSAVLQEEYEDGNFQHEYEIMTEYAGYIGKENIFNFNCDFRMGAPFCAAQLDEFIQSVKEYTGKDKVNLFAVSHGGQVSGTYLTLYGYKGDVNNAVLTVPALGGAGFAYDAMSATAKLDERGVAQFVEYGELCEEDYDWILSKENLSFLDDIIQYILPYVMDIMGYWNSMWDFLPTEHYEEIKAMRLDSGESAKLIANSDYMHYEVMPKFHEGFKDAKAAGTNVYIIAGYDNDIVTGYPESSDAIITISASTGATPAPYGQRFADGYTQINDTGIYQVSPQMNLDASTSYLPYNTWFVENLYHGQTYKDSYTASLMKKLLLTDESFDINSDENYPQFHATTCVSESVFATFNAGKEGYVSSDSNALTLTNLSKKYNLKLLAVSVKGVDIKFSVAGVKSIKPGESVEIPFKGELPKESLKNFEVTVDYSLLGSVTPIGERTFDFTLMNGDAVSYDSSNPFVSDAFENGMRTTFSERFMSMMDRLGITPFLSIIYNVVFSWFAVFGKLLKIAK